MRDVRLVRDALLAERDWSSDIFTPYAEERAERMQRLRFRASLVATLENEFGTDATERRRRAVERRNDDPSLFLAFFAAFDRHGVPHGDSYANRTAPARPTAHHQAFAPADR